MMKINKLLLVAGLAALGLLIGLVAYRAGEAQVPVASLQYYRVTTVTEPTNNAFIFFDHGIAATKDQLMTVAKPQITVNDSAITQLDYQLTNDGEEIYFETYSTWNESNQPRPIDNQINFKPRRQNLAVAQLKNLEVKITVIRLTDRVNEVFATSYPKDTETKDGSGGQYVNTFTYPVKLSRYYSAKK